MNGDSEKKCERYLIDLLRRVHDGKLSLLHIMNKIKIVYGVFTIWFIISIPIELRTQIPRHNIQLE